MLAAVECTVAQLLPGGDHVIVLGDVQQVATGDHDAAPLLFWRGRYGSMDAGRHSGPMMR